MAAAMQEAVRHTVRTEQSAAETPAHFRRTDVYIRGEALMDAVATVPALAALGKAWRRQKGLERVGRLAHAERARGMPRDSSAHGRAL